jgi:transcriptional regulator with XRE-family HTH domain
MLKEFSSTIKTARLKQDLSLRDLAELTGLDHSYIARLEKGGPKPSRDTVLKLAKALKIPENTLLVMAGYSGDPSTPAWWHRDTPPSDVELEEFLKTANIYFDGAPLNEEDKEDILTYLKVKWEREKKKRKKENKR